MTTLDVARITVVTNERGANNLDLLYRRLAVSPKKPSAKPGTATATAAASPLQFLIRNLDVRLDEVIVKDERAGNTPEHIHPLAFKRTYRNVTPDTKFNNDLPPAMTEAGKNIGELVTGDLKKLVANVTQPIDRKTYAYGDLKENATGAARKLEERAKP